ncbi:hypothetical protein [uncultured Sphingobacterium sp.]|uniref:nSTAND3 domain-containing NTPase n=1 Tax=uncultured Sphingobacterium sp. TaxID=182688 RepID=UPI0025CCA147|nr:hypothetical protein [uncultured Sphingobacterium sp.]
MERLQAIEIAIQSINETVFQELCDSFLKLRNENYSAFSRVGSMNGKQKTAKGTPDSLFLLPSGKYIFVEFSTNITLRTKKLKEDINKCLDINYTNIPSENISEIILCINFNLNNSEIEELRQFISNTRIRLTIYTLDSISIEILLHHRDLAHRYLGLPLDSGQIVSLERFIQEYNKASKSIATPLDNEFIHRQKEKELLIELLNQIDFLIITGAPGVGKTKLAIELIEEFINNNFDYKAYCISYKNYTLLEDLYKTLDTNKNYILFVDDANRIDAFNQITGFYKAIRTGKLKIIVTVRDYAYFEVERLCFNFKPSKFELFKLNDDEIKDIISSEKFGIKNSVYQKQIIQIADGNPRIAIMAAILAKKYNRLEVLNDVSELFNNYFTSFIQDQVEFANTQYLKVLGLIGFFYTLPYKDKNAILPILNNYDIKYQEFVEIIDSLDKLELIDIQFENVKIAEQNLSIYFFYKVFIETNLLSLETLLNNYFANNQRRFRECIISSNNTFGPQKVISKVKPALKSYLKNVTTLDESFDFLSTFWFYLRDETFYHILLEINKFPEPELIVFNTSYETNQFSFERDNLLELISNYFDYSHNLKDALNIAFKYISKRPSYLPELIYKIREKLTFDIKDQKENFSRQAIMWEVIEKGIDSNSSLFYPTFIELAITFLKFSFQHTEGGRNNTFSWYWYKLPNNESIKDIRTRIFRILKTNYRKNIDRSRTLLSSYLHRERGENLEIISFEIPLIIEIIETHLDKNSFVDCKFVQTFIRSVIKLGFESPEFKTLKHRFQNSIYKFYLKIDWDRFRDKEIYEFDNYKEYDQIKEKEIREYFTFNSLIEVEDFYKNFVYLIEVAENRWNYNRALEIIIDENLNKRYNRAIDLLSIIANSKNKIHYIPHQAFKVILKDLNAVKLIWNIIESNDFELKLQWNLSFFQHLDENYVDQYYVNKLLYIIQNISSSTTLYFDDYYKYLNIDPLLFEKILKTINKKFEQSIEIYVWDDFFSVYYEYLGNDQELIVNSYISQYRIQRHFDHELVAFSKLLTKDLNFLLKFEKEIFGDKYLENDNEFRNFSIVWNYEGIQDVMFEIFDYFTMIEKHYHAILPVHLNMFFKNLSEQQKEVANEFLYLYVKQNSHNSLKINIVIDIVRHSRKELFEKIINIYISSNSNVNDFKEIWWRGNGGSYSGDVIFGDIEAVDWRNILNMVEKSKHGIEIYPIKKYLIDQEANALKSAEWERKNRFLERNF